MNQVSRKWVLTVLILCTLVLLAAFATFRYQSYRIGKIGFIIWDNQHGNAASLSPEDFTGYIQQCGGDLDASTPRWTVRYRGVFQQREWTFTFAAPPRAPSR